MCASGVASREGKISEVENMRTTFDDRGRVVVVVGFMWGLQRRDMRG